MWKEHAKRERGRVRESGVLPVLVNSSRHEPAAFVALTHTLTHTHTLVI